VDPRLIFTTSALRHFHRHLQLTGNDAAVSYKPSPFLMAYISPSLTLVPLFILFLQSVSFAESN
jgi:hypothetical protein